MKLIWLVIYLIFSMGTVCAFDYNTLYLDYEEPQKGRGKGKLVSKTKDALLSFSIVEERTDYYLFKLKNLTFGDYSENVMFMAPLVTGKLEFSMLDMNFYYHHFSSKSGVKYKFSF